MYPAGTCAQVNYNYRRKVPVHAQNSSFERDSVHVGERQHIENLTTKHNVLHVYVYVHMCVLL